MASRRGWAGYSKILNRRQKGVKKILILLHQKSALFFGV